VPLLASERLGAAATATASITRHPRASPRSYHIHIYAAAQANSNRALRRMGLS